MLLALSVLYSISFQTGDRIVDLAEFTEYRASQIKHPATDNDIEKDFRGHDFNGDGLIVSSELSIVMNVFYEKKFTKKDIDGLLAQADKNLDGKVNYKGTIT